MKSVSADDWTAELTTITRNAVVKARNRHSLTVIQKV